eukprot:1161469-Pelagomonas_calceolata.AAC.17
MNEGMKTSVVLRGISVIDAPPCSMMPVPLYAAQPGRHPGKQSYQPRAAYPLRGSMRTHVCIKGCCAHVDCMHSVAHPQEHQ